MLSQCVADGDPKRTPNLGNKCLVNEERLSLRKEILIELSSRLSNSNHVGSINRSSKVRGRDRIRSATIYDRKQSGARRTEIHSNLLWRLDIDVPPVNRHVFNVEAVAFGWIDRNASRFSSDNLVYSMFIRAACVDEIRQKRVCSF